MLRIGRDKYELISRIEQPNSVSESRQAAESILKRLCQVYEIRPRPLSNLYAFESTSAHRK
jgi:hypothetical protein